MKKRNLENAINYGSCEAIRDDFNRISEELRVCREKWLREQELLGSRHSLACGEMFRGFQFIRERIRTMNKMIEKLKDWERRGRIKEIEDALNNQYRDLENAINEEKRL